MKKVLFLMLLLSGCMSAPRSSFPIDTDTDMYTLQAAKIETVSMLSNFDLSSHIENKMPITPEQAILNWTQNHLKPIGGDQEIWLILNKAEIIKTDIPHDSMFTPNEVTYTLNYEMEIQQREENQIVYQFPVAGTGFITMTQKASLAKKEQGIAELIQKMLTHLKTKTLTELKDLLVS